jgi:hypothetical protein
VPATLGAAAEDAAAEGAAAVGGAADGAVELDPELQAATMVTTMSAAAIGRIDLERVTV